MAMSKNITSSSMAARRATSGSSASSARFSRAAMMLT
jgi:hypothetical protein